jgi:anaerobic magnesium-protoporphyrin IX monomethyl ester cyclase
MKKKIFLIHFAFNFPISSETPYPPSGVLYVGNALKQAGYDVKVRHYHSTEVYTITDVEQMLIEKPLFIGLSMVSGAPVYYGAKFAEMVKTICPDIPIIVGGVHPSLQPKECLELPYFDICVIGEGEETIVELAKVIEEDGDYTKVQGIAYKTNNEIMINIRRPYIENLDKYRQEWSLIDVNKYVRKDKFGLAFHVITSRGCPFGCGFCYNLTFNPGRRWRSHSVEFVMKEISQLHDRTGATVFTFNDDNFFVDKKRAFDILERCQKIGVTADYVEIRVDSITEEVIREITRMKVKIIFVGWESGSDRTLEKIAKGYTRELILKKFKLINDIAPDLIVSGYAIIGFPCEDQSDIASTLDTALQIHKIHPNTTFKIQAYLPFPGTPLYQDALKYGFVPIKLPIDWLKISKGVKPNRPWLSSKMSKNIDMIEKYSQMVYFKKEVSPSVRIITCLFSQVAVFRLRSRFFSLPFDIMLRDIFLRVYRYFKKHEHIFSLRIKIP